MRLQATGRGPGDKVPVSKTLGKGESEHLEHKKSLGEWQEIVESIAAFATTKGGIIRIGIAPDGKHTGIQVGKGTIEDLANRIRINTQPPQYPSITWEGPDKEAVITLEVQESPVKPVWAFNRPIKRVGKTNQRLSPDETRRLMETTTGRSWDSLPCEEMTIADIDKQAVERYLFRSRQDLSTTADKVLENLGLITRGGLRNSAALLFAAHPQRFFPEAKVQCARFAGTTSVRFLDERSFDGNVLMQLDEAMAFVARNTQQAIVITGKPERDIVPEYPEEAVREAITNAICHRDYSMVGTIQVRIYDDRLEVWNPGTLPAGLSLESLYHEHPSCPTNPLLADALYRARVIEHWGTGTIRIVESCLSRGMPKPEFIADMRTFIVRFPKAAVGDVVILQGPERLEKAVRHVRQEGSIRRSEYQELAHISERQARTDLALLVEHGVLVRKGIGRAAHFILRES